MSRVASSCLILALALAAPLLADDAVEPSDPEAERIMLAAHLARSGWGGEFPGFSAQAAVTLDGEHVQGTVTVQPGGAVALDAPTGPAAEWAVTQLESIAMHRSAEVRERYDVSFADDVTDNPLGRLIKFHGGGTHSLYRIKDDVITEVHRRMEGVRFTISVTDVTRTPESKVLPRHFNVSYWDDTTGDLKSNSDFQDEWVRVDDFDLPARRLMIRTAKDQRQVAELVLSGHELLSAATGE